MELSLNKVDILNQNLTANNNLINNNKDDNNNLFETLKDKINIQEIKTKINDLVNEIKDKLKVEGDSKGVDLKKLGLGLLGLVLGGALALATFNLALYPISFVIQLLVSTGLPLSIPQNILNLLQTVFGLSVMSAQYGSILAGSVSGAKTFYNLNNESKINVNNPDNINTEELLNKQLQESIEKFKNSDGFKEYIRNGFNVGVGVSQKISESSGNVVGILIGLGLSLALMSPLALLVASLIVGKVGLLGALGAGLITALPLGIKSFNALKEFSKNVFSLVGGAIGGAVGAGIGFAKKIVDSVKGFFKKDKQSKDKDEFTSNSPYKNQGLEKLADSTGKTTAAFVNGVSDFAALSSVITELLSKEPNGLQFIGKLVAGTLKSYQGAAILKQAAVDNQPELKNVGLFRFLTGFSLLASFLGPLFGPIGIAAFAVLPLVFMALEKVFQAKANLVNNQEKNQENNQDFDKKQEQLKSSYAIGEAGETFINSLGSLGKFWMGWDTLFGGGYGGLTSIFGIVGATKDVIDGARMMTLSDDRSSLKLAGLGLLNIIGGAALFLAAIGLGRVFGFVSLGVSVFKLVYQIMSLMNSKKDNSNNKAEAKVEVSNQIDSNNNNLLNNSNLATNVV
ncbi:MAG: hypothetical protein QXO21_04805 [Candidatus Anstonellales archaeon]